MKASTCVLTHVSEQPHLLLHIAVPRGRAVHDVMAWQTRCRVKPRSTRRLAFTIVRKNQQKIERKNGRDREQRLRTASQPNAIMNEWLPCLCSSEQNKWCHGIRQRLSLCEGDAGLRTLQVLTRGSLSAENAGCPDLTRSKTSSSAPGVIVITGRGPWPAVDV